MATYSVKKVDEPLNIQGDITVTTLECPNDVNVVQYTEEFDYLMAGFSDGGIRAFDSKLSVAFSLTDDQSKKTYCTGLKHRPVSKNYPITNTLMCTYGSGLIKWWSYNFKECIFTTEEQRLTMGVAYHPKISKLVTFGNNCKINVYDEDSKRQERVLSASDEKGSTNGHTGTVTCACFHPRNVNELISGGLDSTVQIWDTRLPNAARNVQGITINGPGLEFTQKATEFLTCSPNSKAGPTLKMWEYATGKEMPQLEPDKFKQVPLYCGTHLNKNLFACGGGEPNFLRVMDLTTMKSVCLIAGIQKPVKSITVGASDVKNVPVFAFSAGQRIYVVKPK